ncbi:MAG: hypothetical protein LJE91_11225 [Gammaproteobacteria bacterium]|nr:hypothetical protein [Gammaproteobacteria bacterium]
MRIRTTERMPHRPLPAPRLQVEMYDSGFRCESRGWAHFMTAARRDESRNMLLAELAIEQVEQRPTLLLAETVEQVRLLEEYTGDGVVIHELITKSVLDQARIDMHNAPLLLATYLTASADDFTATHWRALVLGSPLSNRGWLLGYLNRLSKPAPGKETATIVDLEDPHCAAYRALCNRLSVYSRMDIPVRRVA